MAYFDTDLPIMSGNSGNNGGGMWGSDGIWAILLLALLGRGGFGGQGGYGGGSNCGCGGYGFDNFGYHLGQVATTNDVANGFAQNTLQRGIDDILLAQTQGFAGLNTVISNATSSTNYNMLQGFHGVDNALCNLGFNLTNQINGIGSKIDMCCCDLKTMNLENRYLNERQTCEILQNQSANTQRIIDYLTCKENQNLRDENFALRLQASQAKQNAYLINEIKPCPIPAYITCNPNTGLTYPQGFTQANFANNGCCGCGNTF